MTLSLIETARQYSVANGGHAATAATISVPPAQLIEYFSGRREPSRAVAAGLAPLIGTTPNRLLQADLDEHLARRRGSS